MATIIGTVNNETLKGGTGDDIIDGGAGNDVIIGGGGKDTLLGGAGNDTIYYDPAAAVISGGTGTDTLTAASMTTGLTDWKIGQYTDIENFVGTKYNDTIRWSSTAAVIDGGAGVNTITAADQTQGVSMNASTGKLKNFNMFIGGSGNDIMYGSYYGNDTLRGGAGNDDVRGGYGKNVLDGGAGDDYIKSNGSDTVTGGVGNDTIICNYGGSSSLDGGDGNDYIDAYWGRSTILGGAGDDTIVYDPNAVKISGGTGTDTLTAAPLSTLTTGLANWDIRQYTDIEKFIGTNYNDSVQWDSDATLIDGGGGVNTLTAAGQTQSAAIDLTSAKIKNFTTVIGGLGNDTLIAGSVNSTLKSGAGNDVVQGGKANDVLMGGAGNDTLVGGLGSDTISGGGGADCYQFTGTWGNDVITYGSTNDDDVISFGSGILKQNISAVHAGTDVVVTAAGCGTVTIKNWDDAQLDTMQLFDGSTVSVNSLLGNPSKSAAATSGRKEYAMLVGIGDYAGTSYDSKCPSGDIASVEDFLGNNRIWQDATVSEIRDSQADPSTILSGFNNLATQVQAGDNVLLYYSGHGGASGSWFTEDLNSLALQDIYGAVTKIGSKVGASGHVTLIEDTCYSGKMVDYFKAQNPGCQYTVMSSSAATEESAFSATNSAFSNGLFNNGLNGYQADLNKDGAFSTLELSTYCTTGAGSLGSSQHVQIYDGSKGSYLFG